MKKTLTFKGNGNKQELAVKPNNIQEPLSILEDVEPKILHLKKYFSWVGVLFLWIGINHCEGKEDSVKFSINPSGVQGEQTRFDTLPEEIPYHILGYCEESSDENCQVDRRMYSIVRSKYPEFYNKFDYIEKVFFELKDLEYILPKINNSLERYEDILTRMNSVISSLREEGHMPLTEETEGHTPITEKIIADIVVEKKEIEDILIKIQEIEVLKTRYFQDSFMQEKEDIRKIRACEITKRKAEEVFQAIVSLLEKGKTIKEKYLRKCRDWESISSYISSFLPPPPPSSSFLTCSLLKTQKKDVKKCNVFPGQIERIKWIIQKNKNLGIPYHPELDKLLKYKTHRLLQAQERLKMIAEWEEKMKNLPEERRKISLKDEEKWGKFEEYMGEVVIKEFPSSFYCHYWDVIRNPLYDKTCSLALESFLKDEEEKINKIIKIEDIK